MTTDELWFHTMFGNQKATYCMKHTSAESLLVDYSKGSGNLGRQKKKNLSWDLNIARNCEFS